MRVLLASLAAAAMLGALLFARPHATPGPPMRDFEAYDAAGSVALHGGNAYDSVIWNAERRMPGVANRGFQLLPFAGPPALLPLLAQIARLPLSSAVALWRALLALSMAALALLALRFARLRAAPLNVLCACVAVLGFGPVTSAFALGQMALPAYACAALALIVPIFALGAWLQPNVGLALIGTKRAASALVFAAACIIVAGPAGIGSYVAMLRAHALAERFSVIQFSPSAILYGFGAPQLLALEAGTAIALLAVTVWLLFMVRLRDPLERFAVTCTLVPFIVPFMHEHDLLILFIPAIVCVLRSPSQRLALPLAGALLGATDWLGLAQRPDGTVQTLLLIAAFAAALLALREVAHRAAARTCYFLVLGVLALIAAAGWYAGAHPAPVWPDAMAALPAGIARLAPAAAWHAEQAATGLFTRSWFFALLRCGPLLGGALLALDVHVHEVIERRDRARIKILQILVVDP